MTGEINAGEKQYVANTVRRSAQAGFSGQDLREESEKAEQALKNKGFGRPDAIAGTPKPFSATTPEEQ